MTTSQAPIKNIESLHFIVLRCRNSCELQLVSCRKYWDLRVVSAGPCSQDCPGLQLGMYTGWGLSRASNKGYCHHDFFRCCSAATRLGLPVSQVRSCCQAR